MKSILSSIFLICSGFSFGQTITQYTTAQAHSHNDYEQLTPFKAAYKQQFGSVEADLFLVNDSLYAAHNREDIKPERTFSKLYLNPILQEIRNNNGQIYSQKDLTLQLLIDLKTPADETLTALVKILKPHEAILAPKGPVKIVVSGNTPPPEAFMK